MYAKIDETELRKLSQQRASGLQTQLYVALATHCHKGNTCFPSLERLRKILGDVYHINSIHRALKWLEEKKFITRKEATSKTRFSLMLRQIKTALTNRLKKSTTGYDKHQRKTNNNNYRYYKKKKPIKRISEKEKKDQIIDDWAKEMTSLKDYHKLFNDPDQQGFVHACKLPKPDPFPSQKPLFFSANDLYNRIKCATNQNPQKSWVWQFYESLS